MNDSRVLTFCLQHDFWQAHAQVARVSIAFDDQRQPRTKKVGFTAFLHARRVPDVISPACQCGWRRQDPKHVILFCPRHAHIRRRLLEAAGTDRYLEILSTGKGLGAVARWVMDE